MGDLLILHNDLCCSRGNRCRMDGRKNVRQPIEFRIDCVGCPLDADFSGSTCRVDLPRYPAIASDSYTLPHPTSQFSCIHRYLTPISTGFPALGLSSRASFGIHHLLPLQVPDPWGTPNLPNITLIDDHDIDMCWPCLCRYRYKSWGLRLTSCYQAYTYRISPFRVAEPPVTISFIGV